MSIALLNTAAATAAETSLQSSSSAAAVVAGAMSAKLDPTSIESKLEKLNLKLLQNKLFQSNRHYFMRMSSHLYSSRSNESSNTSSPLSLSNVANKSSSTTTSSICSTDSGSSSSSSSSDVKGKKAKKVVRFADTLGFDLVTIWCVSNHQANSAVKIRRLSSLEDSEDSSEGSIDDDDLPSSNDEDDYNGSSYWTNHYQNEPQHHYASHQTSAYHHHQPSNYVNLAEMSSSLPHESNALSTPPLVNSTNTADHNNDDKSNTYNSNNINNAIVSSSSNNNNSGSEADECASLPDTFVYDNLIFTWHRRFEQPGLSPDFYGRLNANKVLLESIYSTKMRLDGVVRVLNLAYAKRVFIRYTINNWNSYVDLECQHFSCNNSEQDKLTDRFMFSICLDKSQVLACIDDMSKLNRLPQLKLEFAVCFSLGSDSPTTYWDNNRGQNYQYDCTFKIATKYSPPPSQSIVH